MTPRPTTKARSFFTGKFIIRSTTFLAAPNPLYATTGSDPTNKFSQYFAKNFLLLLFDSCQCSHFKITITPLFLHSLAAPVFDASSSIHLLEMDCYDCSFRLSIKSNLYRPLQSNILQFGLHYPLPSHLTRRIFFCCSVTMTFFYLSTLSLACSFPVLAVQLGNNLQINFCRARLRCAFPKTLNKNSREMHCNRMHQGEERGSSKLFHYILATHFSIPRIPPRLLRLLRLLPLWWSFDDKKTTKAQNVPLLFSAAMGSAKQVPTGFNFHGIAGLFKQRHTILLRRLVILFCPPSGDDWKNN